MHVRPVLLVLSSYSTKEHTNAHANYHNKERKTKRKTGRSVRWYSTLD